MSTNPQTTPEPKPTTQTTEIAARRGSDPWATPDESTSSPARRTQRQFEPTARNRLKNLMDDENAYCK
ncbi:hypothetical protein [Natronomonas sp. LN261]|jgi:hypothetical protein|uniref:hypothetical protein n=1 Tax=Natronomonas sp. LN261 TaxID=2750669 RepID=UPI0015EE9D08|nr:hypothetical protein [Natronomonas sp. LN261]